MRQLSSQFPSPIYRTVLLGRNLGLTLQGLEPGQDMAAPGMKGRGRTSSSTELSEPQDVLSCLVVGWGPPASQGLSNPGCFLQSFLYTTTEFKLQDIAKISSCLSTICGQGVSSRAGAGLILLPAVSWVLSSVLHL